MKLTHEITRMYYNEDTAKEAEKIFIETFKKHEVPDDVLEIRGDLIQELIAHEVVSSKTELRHLIEAGGVRDAETGEKLSEFPLTVSEPLTLKIGKRRFVKLIP